MAKKTTTTNPDMKKEVIFHLNAKDVGTIDLVLNEERILRSQNYLEHLKKRRKIRSINLEQPLQYTNDPLVKFYVEQNIDQNDAVSYAASDYESRNNEAQMYALIAAMVDGMFLIDNRKLQLNPELTPFEYDEKFFDNEEVNRTKLETGDAPIPSFDRNSVIEEKIAYIRTLSEKDPEFGKSLLEKFQMAFNKFQAGEFNAEVVKDTVGFQS